MASATKLLKEEFVSNLSGTTMMEISALLATASLLTVLRQLVGHLCQTGRSTQGGTRSLLKMPGGTLPEAILDLALLVAPSVALTTVLADWQFACLGATCLVIASLLVLARVAGVPLWSELPPSAPTPQLAARPLRAPYLSTFRSMMVTLAPRRLLLITSL
eukprot:jgi/Mesen1/3132/ME000184S02199